MAGQEEPPLRTIHDRKEPLAHFGAALLRAQHAKSAADDGPKWKP
jgi:hypothetical protein